MSGHSSSRGRTRSRAGFTPRNAYSISTESGATVYGGIEAARLTDTQLELRLTVQAAGVLGVSNELVLRFKDAAGAETGRVGLRRVGIAASSA